jgi:hypothetical protein
MPRSVLRAPVGATNGEKESMVSSLGKSLRRRFRTGSSRSWQRRRIYRVTLFICSLAADTTASTVNPNFFCSSFRGADAPKVLMPMRSPSRPTYRSQPNRDAFSTETRALMSEGRTDSRYASSCCSNNSQDGMLTTRASMPCCFRAACASTQSETSLPVAISNTFGFPSVASERTSETLATARIQPVPWPWEFLDDRSSPAGRHPCRESGLYLSRGSGCPAYSQGQTSSRRQQMKFGTTSGRFDRNL